MRIWRFRTIVAAVVATVALAGHIVAGAGFAAAATCQVSTPPAPATYSVSVCLDLPLPGEVLIDTREVTATVMVVPGTGPAPEVNGVVFSWAPAPATVARVDLLADHFPDYRMTLVPSRLPTSGGSLQVRAVLTDGFTTARTSVPVTVSSLAPPPPVHPQFTPWLGSARPPGQRFLMAAVGDGVDGSPAAAGVADLIASWNPDAFAYLGDVYDRGTPYEFDTWYGDPNGYGRFRAITNPAVGNHEYMRDPVAAPYFEFWGNVPHFYSYDVAGWHVVVLDSTLEFNQVTPGTVQYDWLAADLASHQGGCTLTYLHHPRYTSVANVSRPDLAPLWSLLVEGGVTLTLTGHAHTYERWTPMDSGGVAVPGGMTQFVVGTGGRPIENPKIPDPRVLADYTTPGALRLDLGAQDAAFAFVGADGTVRDAGTVPCRPSGTTPTPATPQPPSPTAVPASSDTTAPTTPGSPRVSSVTPTAATISWRPSTDNAAVTGYTIRRAGVPVSTLGPTATAYRDGKLTAGHRYSWTVEAVDAAGNRSPATPAVAATTPFPQRSSRTLLGQLRRAPEHPRGYASARFPGEVDADGDRCRTSAEVLLQEAVQAPAVGPRCVLTGGRWFSPYDGASLTQPRLLAVDHLVPLAEAWQSGAYRWTRSTRSRHANDLAYPSTLVAASRATTTAKAGQEPQRWMPRKAYRCSYAAQWVAVKWRWHLAVDPPERRFLVRTLSSCHWPSVQTPKRAPVNT